MGNPKPVFVLSAGFLLVCLIPVFSSDPSARHEPVPPGNPPAEEDPLNPYVGGGDQEPPAKTGPGKPLAPAKQKPAKKPKKNPTAKAPSDTVHVVQPVPEEVI